MTEELLAAVEAYSDLSRRLKEADEALNKALTNASFADALTTRRRVEAEWAAARDEVVEAAQQWAAHYG